MRGLAFLLLAKDGSDSSYGPVDEGVMGGDIANHEAAVMIPFAPAVRIDDNRPIPGI